MPLERLRPESQPTSEPHEFIRGSTSDRCVFYDEKEKLEIYPGPQKGERFIKRGEYKSLSIGELEDGDIIMPIRDPLAVVVKFAPGFGEEALEYTFGIDATVKDLLKKAECYRTDFYPTGEKMIVKKIQRWGKVITLNDKLEDGDTIITTYKEESAVVHLTIANSRFPKFTFMVWDNDISIKDLLSATDYDTLQIEEISIIRNNKTGKAELQDVVIDGDLIIVVPKKQTN